MTITEAILRARKAFGKSGYDINNGLCEDFMWRVGELMGGYTDANSDELSDFAPDCMDGRLPGHYAIRYKGKYYDAECPEGVDHWQDLPLFKRFFKRHPKLREQSFKWGAESVRKPEMLSYEQFVDMDNFFTKDFLGQINEASIYINNHHGKLNRAGPIMRIEDAVNPTIAAQLPGPVRKVMVWFATNVNGEHLGTYCTGKSGDEWVLVMNPEQARTDYVPFFAHEIKHLIDRFSNREVAETPIGGDYRVQKKLPSERRAVHAEKALLRKFYRRAAKPAEIGGTR